ncbi:hypothetical protein M885DRAFT_617517 [Pelagophyceae sp. CCMP2097]|nr:hypothetical protein M885DRAFT_617517 [Pelagophyceae sp. CCMP2097]
MLANPLPRAACASSTPRPARRASLPIEAYTGEADTGLADLDEAAMPIPCYTCGSPTRRERSPWPAAARRTLFPDNEKTEPEAQRGNRRPLRWRVPITLGLLLASCLCIASVIGLLQGATEDGKALEGQKHECTDVRDRVSEWGKRLSVEASTFFFLMARERDVSEPKTPFLAPGVLTSAVRVERLVRMAKEFQEEPPIVVWHPTVRLEDRAAYEAYAGELSGGGPVDITDMTDASSLTPSHKTAVPAAERETYNPLTLHWAVAESGGDELGMDAQQLVGMDAQERYRQTLPAVLAAKFFDDGRLIAHAPYLSNRETVSDFSLSVLVPYVDEACLNGGECFYDAQTPVLGYVSFTLRADKWLFPENVQVTSASTGDVIKTVQSGYQTHVQTREAFLDLDLECYHRNELGTKAKFSRVCTAISVLFIGLNLLLLWRLEVEASRGRRRTEQQIQDAAAAEQRMDERIRYRFEMGEKTERYLNHEVKNRIFVLGQSCAEQPLQLQIDDLMEVLNSKAALMRLSTGRYKPSWCAVETNALIEIRWQRFVAANSPFDRPPATGAAKHRTGLELDVVLFNIILDNILSNAFKYGDASKPPSLGLHIEPLDGNATRVSVSLELRNWAGPEHAALLQMGEEELNVIAHAEGRRAHEHSAEVSSGDGFPMAAAAASALGGTLRLVLLPDGVVAILELPDIVAVLPGAARRCASPRTEVELTRLKVAMADDSATFRKTFVRLAGKVTSQEPVTAGATRESIDDFPRMIVDSDVDVVLLDFNFAPVHHTKTGVDICRECRLLDAEEGNEPRLIFIVSANDSSDDAERYRAAGADGSLGKKLTAAKLRQILEDAVRTHPRFAASRRAGSPVTMGAWQSPRRTTRLMPRLDA